jgi:cell division protein FtsQ
VAKKTKPSPVPTDSFWDKPPLMNLVADVLLLLGGAVLAWSAVTLAQRLPGFALRQVVVVSPLRQVTPMQIDYVVRDAVSGNFFTVNLDTVRATFEKLPWVRHADVRRRWPDALELTIEEHVAAGRWQQQDGESRLVNDKGEVFSAALEGNLPALAGPEGAAGEVLNRYREFNRALSPLGLTLHGLALSPRQAWQAKLDDGLALELGRDEAQHPVADRMARFIASYGEVRNKIGTALISIDMRYPNGFAVRAAPTTGKHS